MGYTRRVLVMLFVMGLSFSAAAASSAQEIRYFVVQSTGLFEIRNVSTGGRFTIAPTGESIFVPGTGVRPVRGFTDRAARGETVVTQIRGSGVAHVRVTFQTQGRSTVNTIFAGNLGLPAVVPQRVSLNPNVDNVTVTVRQQGRSVARRLPIGGRPR